MNKVQAKWRMATLNGSADAYGLRDRYEAKEKNGIWVVEKKVQHEANP